MGGASPIDRMFKAFADETRLRILHLLTRGELCVCDIVETLRLPQPRVSRHLAYLRGAGLVRVRRDGLWKHYSLAETKGRFHRSLLSCLRGCFSEADVLRRDAERLKRSGAGKACR
jgi:ArsR family transcriptional regulator